MSLSLPGQLSARPIGAVRPVRRVRHEVRDGLAVIAFSVVASSGLALALMLFLSMVD